VEVSSAKSERFQIIHRNLRSVDCRYPMLVPARQPGRRSSPSQQGVATESAVTAAGANVLPTDPKLRIEPK
jgi:hypothetical protein